MMLMDSILSEYKVYYCLKIKSTLIGAIASPMKIDPRIGRFISSDILFAVN